MAFTVGTHGAVRPSMNVTPLVDVVLVLLIIFMVITPLLAKQFFLHAPKKDPAADKEPPRDAPPPLVLSVGRDGQVRLDRELVELRDLGPRLRRVLAARGEQVVFFGAHPDLDFARAMEVLDTARGGGAATLVVMTEPLAPPAAP